MSGISKTRTKTKPKPLPSIPKKTKKTNPNPELTDVSAITAVSETSRSSTPKSYTEMSGRNPRTRPPHPIDTALSIRLSSIKEDRIIHPLVIKEIVFAKKLSKAVNQAASFFMVIDSDISFIQKMLYSKGIYSSVVKASQYSEMLLDEFDMEDLVESCHSQDSVIAPNAYSRIPVKSFSETDAKYLILYDILDKFKNFKSETYNDNRYINVVKNDEGNNVEIRVENIDEPEIDLEGLEGLDIPEVLGDFNFEIKIKHKMADFVGEGRDCRPTAIKLKFIIDIIYNDSTICHVSFFGDKSIEGIQGIPYIRMSSLHFTIEGAYTFTGNKEYVYLNLDNTIRIYELANGNIKTFISLILKIVSTIFNISLKAKSYQASSISKLFKDFVEKICMKVITPPDKLRSTKKLTITMRKATDPHDTLMGGSNIKKLSTAKPAKKPTAKPAKKPPAKPAKKPVAKPAKKPPAKPAKKPVAKPAKKPATKPAKKPTAKPAKKPTAKPAKKPVKKIRMTK
jgi:hypothetical protein